MDIVQLLAIVVATAMYPGGAVLWGVSMVVAAIMRRQRKGVATTWRRRRVSYDEIVGIACAAIALAALPVPGNLLMELPSFQGFVGNLMLLMTMEICAVVLLTPSWTPAHTAATVVVSTPFILMAVTEHSLLLAHISAWQLHAALVVAIAGVCAGGVVLVTTSVAVKKLPVHPVVLALFAMDLAAGFLWSAPHIFVWVEAPLMLIFAATYTALIGVVANYGRKNYLRLLPVAAAVVSMGLVEWHAVAARLGASV